MYRPTIKHIEEDYHIEITHKEGTYDKPIGCYINARDINGELSNNKPAIRLDIEPDRKPVKIFIDGKEYTGTGAVIIL